jgi:hypothetical protein
LFFLRFPSQDVELFDLLFHFKRRREKKFSWVSF